MSNIAVVKIRCAQDFEFHAPSGLTAALKLLRRKDMLRRIHRSAGLPYMPQLTLPYLAGIGETYNEQHGTRHSYTLIDDWEEKVDLNGFDMVWFTVSTSNALATYKVADRLRERGIPTVLGGIHASFLPEEASAHATSVATGEAEGVLFDILRDFDTRKPLKALYKGRRKANLDQLPVPRWHDAAVTDYCPLVVPVQTSRGCRNACNFCSTTRFHGVKRRHRPVEEIVAEIRALQKQGVITPHKTVFFTDNNIVYDADNRQGIQDSHYARRLFEALRPLDIAWVGQGEIGVAKDPALVELMARSGCYMLLVGLESINQGSVESTGKRCNIVSDYGKAIDTLHSHGIAIIGCFVMGLEEDGLESFELTRQFIDEWVDVPQVSLLTPFPGTALYKRMKREGRLLHEDWSRYDITHVVFRPRTMSPEALAEHFNEMTRDVYRHRNNVKRALRYAFRCAASGMPRADVAARFTAVLLSNLVYRGINRVGFETRQQLAEFGDLTLSGRQPVWPL